MHVVVESAFPPGCPTARPWADPVVDAVVTTVAPARELALMPWVAQVGWSQLGLSIPGVYKGDFSPMQSVCYYSGFRCSGNTVLTTILSHLPSAMVVSR